MLKYPQSEEIKSIVEQSNRIVIIQADNPDGDSLASALALEQILGDLGKDPILYCGVDMPKHLTYLKGWDRVVKELPASFDSSIIVDTSSDILLEQLEATNQKMWVRAKPCIILDHHRSEERPNYATVICNQKVSSTGELIYELAAQLKWQLNLEACKFIAISILSDSLGLTSEGASSRSIHIIAELVEREVKLPELETSRREMMRRSADLVHYKGQLLQRVEYFYDNSLAVITIPWDEIEKYSHDYNPSMLVIDDMRLTENTKVAIAYKTYPDGKITAKIRCNYGFGIANKLAEKFDGGGHSYASGFKIQDGRAYSEIKNESLRIANDLLTELEESK